MESINFEVNQSSEIYIRDFPDAAGVVRPTDNFSGNTKLKHLALHYYDLNKASDILQKITQ